MLQSLILIDALSSVYWEKKKEKEKRSSQVFFFPRARGQTHLAGCDALDFYSC
jgi:hypothetical protein